MRPRRLWGGGWKRRCRPEEEYFDGLVPYPHNLEVGKTAPMSGTPLLMADRATGIRKCGGLWITAASRAPLRAKAARFQPPEFRIAVGCKMTSIRSQEHLPPIY